MSLRIFEMKEIDPKLNFIVGPNGSGKSSVFRAIRTLIEGARCVGQGQPLEDGQLLCTQGSTAQEFEVALDVEFDTTWEREIITTYLCAAFAHPSDVRDTISHLEPNPIANDDGAAQYANWLLDILRPESIPFLFRGELRFYYGHFVRDYVRLTYTFEIDNVPLAVNMGSQFSHYGVFTIGHPPAGLSGTPTIGQMMLDGLKKTKGYAAILETIQGKPSASQVLPGSIDMKEFVLGLAATNAVIEVKTLPRTHTPYPGPHKRLHNLAGRKFDDQQSVFTLAELFHVLLTHGVVMTSNFRYPPERTYTYTPQETTPTGSGLYDDRQLVQRLFDLKNGDSAARETYRSIQETFERITGDGMKFDLISSANDGAITLQIHIMENGSEIPITYHGAGIWEALVLSTLLIDNAGKVTLLDEPASNLHPQMQRKFIGVVEHTQNNVWQGQVIIVTHSQHLLPTQAKDLPKIRRVQRVDYSTVALCLGSGSKIPLDKLEKEMGQGSDLAGLLFASGVILVEGPTETGAIGIWFPQLAMSGGRTLADSNIALFGVNGVQNLPFHIQYLVEFGIPWAAICDVDALDLTTKNDLWRKMVELGALKAVPTANVFDELKSTATTCGIFTANTALVEKGFEEIPDVKAYVDAHESELPDKNSKPRRGQYIAHHLNCPDGVGHTIQAALEWLNTSAVETVSQYARRLEPTV